ncbi:unnamed protein product [Sphagnum jensenii]|uniref:LAGLIDADG homing endonuclease n=1 Tax=Sphagnum jensenii TaxID=128206 RepID=A0ABP1BGC2_9BRYO
MTLRYGLADAWGLDSFRKMSKKNFTFDNGRSRPQSAISRINKFMVSQGVEERGGKMEATTSIRKLSDHSPLTIKIWGHHPPPSNSTRFFNVTLLSEKKRKLELLNAWSGDATRPSTGRDWATWLEEAMERVANCNARMAKEKRKKKALMKELEIDFGTITGQQDLTHYVTRFYTRLYTSNAGSPSTAAAQDLC